MVKLSLLVCLSWMIYASAAPISSKKARGRHGSSSPGEVLMIPNKTPSDASDFVSRHYASLSIEWVDMLDYLGTPSEPSSFAIQLLQNLKDRVGVSPVIRMSGSSIDAFLLGDKRLDLSATNGPDYPDFILSTKTSYRPQDANIQNPPDLGFLNTMANISSQVGTKWIVGLDFGQNDIDNTKMVAQYSASVLGNSLYALELGNEPSQYGKSYQGFRDGNTWNIDTYVKQNGEWVNEIEKAVLDVVDTLPNNGLFQGGALCCSWAAEDVIKAGFFDAAGNTTGSIAEHFYWGGCPNKMDVLLDHSGIIQSISNRIGSSIDLARAANKDYVLGEFNSFLHGGCDGVSNAFGAALFGVDILLWGASANIRRAHLHSSSFVSYSVWYGADKNIVGPLYYSYLMVDEAIGPSDNTQVVEIKTQSSSISAYAFYDSGDFKRLVLINHDIVNGDSHDPSPITLNINGPNSSNVTTKVLSAPTTFEKSRITWAGQTMNHSPDGTLQGEEVSDSIDASNPGSYTITVQPSSAVLVFFN